MIQSHLSHILRRMGASKATEDLAPALLASLPPHAAFEAPIWNVLPWSQRPGNRRVLNINLSKIENEELRLICRVWILHGRLTREVGVASAALRLSAVLALDVVTKGRPINSLITGDFNRAEKWLSENFAAGTAFGRAACLQALSRWLNKSFALRLDYHNRLLNPIVHGRYGSDDGRTARTIPLEVLRDLIAATNKKDLIPKDVFFLRALVVDIACGFRISELATVPEICVLKEERGLQILYFPEKGGAILPRPVHPALAEAVEQSVSELVRLTSGARTVAKAEHERARLDWRRIITNPAAFRYFVKKWAHDWTSQPEHCVRNRSGAWFNAEKRYIDALGEWEAAGRNISQAARRLGLRRLTFAALLAEHKAIEEGRLVECRKAKGPRTKWDSDSRVISFCKLERHLGVKLSQRRRLSVRDIICSAQELQVKGKRYPRPTPSNKYEDSYRIGHPPVVLDRSGKALLELHEALFVIERYALSSQRKSQSAESRLLTDRDFNGWLAGESRSRGTRNHEDSVFSRLNILDPRTGQTASFTWHEVRSWLDTVYEQGGLTQQQIALIFGRKTILQNAAYDQTDSKTRIERFKQGVRAKMVVGQAVQTYARLAEYSREEAEEYLAASVRMISPMPHGACTLDWSRNPCPHHLSCFKREHDDQGVCEHLIVDPTNEKQMGELGRISREARRTIEVLEREDRAPQLDHFRAVERNVARLIDEGSGMPSGSDVR